MLLLLAIVFPACDDDGDPTTKITIEYDAIMDAGITSSSASRTFGGDYNAWTGFNTIDSKVWRMLLKFNPVIVTSGVKVKKAQLMIWANDNAPSSSGSNTIAAYELTQSWTEGTSTWFDNDVSGVNVSWQNYDGSANSWALAGGDYSEPAVSDYASFISDGLGDRSITLNLDTAMVQGWIGDPSENHGIILKDSSESGDEHYLTIYTREYYDINRCPKLVLTLEL